MKITTKLFFLFFAIFLFSHCNDDENVIVDPLATFEYEVNDSLRSLDYHAEIYKDNFIKIASGGTFFSEVVLLIEEAKEESFILNRNTFSQGIYYPIETQTYSSNIFDGIDNYIQIEKFDSTNLLISGTFEYKGSLVSNIIHSTNITKGKFENIKLERKEGYYSNGIVEATINSEDTKYTNVDIDEFDDYIHIYIQHPRQSAMLINIPKDVEEGVNEITASNLGNKAEIVFSYGKSLNGFWYSYPLEDCQLLIEEIDFENKILKGVVSGKFQYNQSLADDINVGKVALDLHWE